MRYKVIGQINLDGTLYKEGDYILLESAKAEELLKAGCIVKEEKPFHKNSNAQINIGYSEKR